MKTILSPLELDPEISSLAAEAHAALAKGDTPRASKLCKQAGELLEKQLVTVRKQSEKHLLRFLAATQYYHGGLYQKAQRLSREVQPKQLPPEARPLFEKFLSDVRERSSPSYRKAVKKLLLRAWTDKNWSVVLQILQDHPYVLPACDVAVFRACCCENLKDFRAAVLFFEDAMKLKPDDLEIVIAAAAYPLSQMHEENLSEVWEYIRHQLATIHHALPNINASLVRYHQASGATAKEQQLLSKEQIQYYLAAWELYHQMQPDHQQHPDMQDCMALCLEAAVFGFMRLGDEEGAAQTANRAVEFTPNQPSAWTARGVVTYPSQSAIRDFRQAVQLGDMNYYPYYYLAHNAFMRNDFAEAAMWCEQALQRQPSSRIKAQMFEMLAIARSHLQSRREEVEDLFAAAQKLDPENPRIQHNLQVFKEAVARVEVVLEQQWDRTGLQNGIEQENAIEKRARDLLGKRRSPLDLQKIGAS